jgi:hypothetical protein
VVDGLPAPRFRAYPTYTVITEKLHAIGLLGIANSCLKGYFDLSVLEREILGADLLTQVIKAMFERGGIPSGSLGYWIPSSRFLIGYLHSQHQWIEKISQRVYLVL